MANLKLNVIAAMGAALMFTGAAHADVLVGSSDASWQAFPGTLDSNNPNRPYWDQPSLDWGPQNIGDKLANGTLTGSPAAYQWWGKSGSYTSNDDPSFYFQATGSGQSSGLFKLEITYFADSNEIGWYDVNDPSVLHTLWTGADSPSTTEILFTPSAEYGFYRIGPNGTFYTQSALNDSGEAGYQHFAVFADDLTPGSEGYWIGMEDSPAFSTIENMGDYNDFVFHVSAVPSVPEPASLGILGAGAVGLLIRRKRK